MSLLVGYLQALLILKINDANKPFRIIIYVNDVTFMSLKNCHKLILLLNI